MNSILQAGTRLGRYEIKSRLGAGGMGEVYLAEDVKLGRQVALKILHAAVISEEGRVQRFIREAKAASALNHPGILTVYENDEEQGVHYIATEYVEGETLRALIRRGPLPPRDAVGVAAQVASALSVAHAKGIVHRDIKPENIMIRPDGYVKVLDFGIAKLLQPPSTAQADNAEHAVTEQALNTERGVVLGTVQYMSPEQARGFEVDARTDVWSLGVVLYEMLTGRPPFGGPTRADALATILHAEPPSLARIVADVPDELERIVRRALSKEREGRHQTSAELLEDLRRLRERLKADAGGVSSALTGETIMIRSEVSPPPRVAETHPAQQTTEQRRQVTVLFANLSALTDALGHLDDEELGDVMNDLWRKIEFTVAAVGGRVDKHMGDELMAVWGTDAAREDDPEHAIRAALALREEVSEFAREKAQGGRGAQPGGAADTSRLVRVGINTGPALLGASLTGELTTTGAVVNAGKRLMNAAPAGAVLISHDTYRHVRGVFDVQEVGAPGGGDGEAAAPLAYTVIRAKPRAFRLRTRGVEGVETRMVGRKSELKRLTDGLETVFEDRELEAITVLGDAGLGKSRLLYEFSNKVELLPDDCYLFQARASEAMQGAPYALVRELFSLRFEIQDSDTPEVAREKLERGILRMAGPESETQMRAHFIGQLAGLDFSESEYLSGILDDARQIRDRAFHYAAQFFAAVAREAPVLIMLDDIHWADDGSLDFIDHLTRTCADSAMMVLCASRPSLLERRARWGEGHSSHTRIHLQPLSRRESRQLVEEIMRQAESVPQELRELVVARAEGNPFYVEELIKMLIDQKAILPGADEWRVDASRLGEVQVPPTLTGVLQARLDGLTAREKTLLQRASVIGREFWDDAIEYLGGEGRGETTPAQAASTATRDLLQSLRRKELIYQREASSFAGTGEYIFKHALLRDVTYETLLRRERRRLHRRAARWLTERGGGRAGEYAATIAEHYERAEEWPLAAEWYGRAGRQARDTYAPDVAIRYYRKALELLPAGATSEGGGALSLEWYEGLGDVLWRQARLPEAVEAYDRMRAEAERLGDAAAEARAWNGLSLVEDARGEARAALESARRAEQLARRVGKKTATGAAALVTALLRQGYASYRLGDAAEVVRLGEEALARSSVEGAASKRDHARSLHLLGTAYQMAGDSERAYSCKEQSLALMRELGDRQNSGAMLNALGETARLRGDYACAAQFYSDALAIARETGNLSQQLVYLGNLGGARVGQGDYVAAESDLREVVRMADPVGHFALSEVYRFLAEALLGQGKTAEALDTALTALSLGRKTGNPDFIGGAWRVLGLVAARLTETIEIDGETYTVGACFAESYRVFAETGMDAERARTIRDWAQFEEMRGDPEHAAAMREEAREIFTRLGIEAEIERMQSQGQYREQ